MNHRHLHILAALLSILTLIGVLTHDTKIDKATVTALALPAAVGSYSLGVALSSEPHTHIERVSVAKTVRALTTHVPRVQPRNDHKKHLFQKRVTKGVHAFDGYYVPLS